ncbi:N(4)-(Beta-N-acetylglucosaminyl)-L-asparaginase-like isoform X3 [Eublepharis macularius]|uniref:N(4)-(Beta-N-acetylglucosaminyl)-L-asparaginase- like isoform X3 n=1 Tax=Eublepharis macularius TaxID=481883 RepID=A0AA97JN99_EUBMA|nr:N(4)-(Beta-N-acetylglucosaminyl)-L-asparaginase-like isoform X3 [Eublepharis macularius]
MAAAAGTWGFSLPAVERMRQRLLRGGLATDCLQEAMADIENDEETGVFVVGRGGYPNKDGIIQCDAAIMEGQPGRFGAVAALHGIGTPLAVARKVMEETPHSFLVGDGAVAFAKDQGFVVEDNSSLMSKKSTEAYQKYLETKKTLKKHDTLGLIALDIYGNITVGKREQHRPESGSDFMPALCQMQMLLVDCVGPHLQLMGGSSDACLLGGKRKHDMRQQPSGSFYLWVSL